MPPRKQLSNKVRFEVFKRDSFTCQYCGRKAPEIVLNVDHINPVAKGGNNDIINLITSCFECNNGKRHTPLDDQSALAKQQKQMAELNERRVQLEMLMEWRNGMQDLLSLQVGNFVTYIEKYIPELKLTENYKIEIKKWVRKHDHDLIFESIDESANRYLKFTKEGVDRESAEQFLNKIGGILFFKSLPPVDQKISWLKMLVNKKFNANGWDVTSLLSRYANALRNKGWTEDQILNDLQTEVKGVINAEIRYWNFVDKIEKWINDINAWKNE